MGGAEGGGSERGGSKHNIHVHYPRSCRQRLQQQHHNLWGSTTLCQWLGGHPPADQLLQRLLLLLLVAWLVSHPAPQVSDVLHSGVLRSAADAHASTRELRMRTSVSEFHR